MWTQIRPELKGGNEINETKGVKVTLYIGV